MSLSEPAAGERTEPAPLSDTELAARLAEVEAATAPLLEVRDAPLVSRLRRRGVQRAAPAAAGAAAAAAYGRAAWMRRGAARARAIAWADTMLGPGAARAEVARLARRHLIDWSVSSELGWRPWLGRRMPLAGVEHLGAAFAAGRGAIVGMPHFGPQLLLIHALCARGFKPYLVSAGKRTGVLRGADGAWREFSRRHREAAGCRTIWLGGSFPAAQALLERGELVVIAWDVRGKSEVELLGRRVRVRAGAARLAALTGSPLLPGLVWHEHGRPRARIGAPLEPSGDVDALLGALAADLDTGLRTRMPQAHPLMAKLFR